MRTQLIAAVAAVALVAIAVGTPACGPSRQQDEDAGFDAGRVDAGTQDAGPTDAGTQDAGGDDAGTDGGVPTVTVEDLLTGPFPATPRRVRVENVVVSAISNLFRGTQGDYIADFWVADSETATSALWVRKFYTDGPDQWGPTVGDLISLEGWFDVEFAYTERHGYRRVLKSGFDRRIGGDLLIDVLGTASPPADLVVDAGSFGNAQNGEVKANPEHGGARVHVQGPVQIVDPSPPAFKRISARPGDDVYFGFEITGGILVNNYRTFAADGGCPWRDVALDAGSGQTVVFQGGVKGVWDTYTHAPCEDGGTTGGTGCRRFDGGIPGTEADYTYVLYPLTCDDFVGGTVQ